MEPKRREELERWEYLEVLFPRCTAKNFRVEHVLGRPPKVVIELWDAEVARALDYYEWPLRIEIYWDPEEGVYRWEEHLWREEGWVHTGTVLTLGEDLPPVEEMSEEIWRLCRKLKRPRKRPPVEHE